MALEEFFNYKNQLMEDLLTTESIVKLIDCEIPMDQAPSLAYRQVFPFEYIPDTVEHGQTFVCFDVDIQKAPNKTYLSPVIYVWVFSHISELRLLEGGVRTDKLVSEIVEKLNGSRFYGLGTLDLYSVKRFAPLSDYQGKMITFYATDFNNLSPSTKPIPTRRGYA